MKEEEETRRGAVLMRKDGKSLSERVKLSVEADRERYMEELAAEAEEAERLSPTTPLEQRHRQAAQSRQPLEEEEAAEAHQTSPPRAWGRDKDCLLYTSDAADE